LFIVLMLLVRMVCNQLNELSVVDIVVSHDPLAVIRQPQVSL
jgi:hypothetical protein